MSLPHKFARGVSGRPPSHQTPFTVLEIITLVHVGLLVIVAAWAFGGNADWSRRLLAWLGSLGALITLTALQSPEMRKEGRLRPLRWLWPLGIVNVLVVAATFNPSFREVVDGAKTFFVPTASNPHFPSSARPLLAYYQLWFFDGVYLSCFNLAFIVRQRRALRLLFLVLCANAVVLAVFGTVQKLVGASGLYFGLQKSPQIFFFSTFIYHNHWGAFVVLMTAASLGLIYHFVRRRDSRGFFQSPAFGGLVGVLLLAASVPLSGSRSCTLLMALLLIIGFVHWIARLVRQRRAYRESSLVPVGFSLAVFAGLAYFAYDIGRPMIERRLAATEQQVGRIRAQGGLGQRATLYRDTWRLAQAKPWFGWGMASYPTAFYTFNSQQVSPVDGLTTNYHDAHSDWLQAVAEHGFVGGTFLALCALVPLFHRRRALAQSPLTAYLLLGCTLLLLYAWVEFPFGNGAVIITFWACFFCAIHYGRLDPSADAQA